MFKIVLIGKPNVGKTAIFNKLCGRKLGLVYDQPGVTRDANEGNMKLYSIVAKLTDTGGIDEKLSNTINVVNKQVIEIAKSIAEKADCIFFVLDGKNGVTIEDIRIAQLIRKYSDKVLILINKAEHNLHSEIYNEVDKLGFNIASAVQISAEHNVGFVELYKTLTPFYKAHQNSNAASKNKDSVLKELEEVNNRVVKIAVIGRPNAGKSTLINTLLSQKRLITSDVAGTTRDQIIIDLLHNGRDIQLIDTAGIRKRLNIADKLEEKTIEASFDAIKFCHLALLVIDVEYALEDQDLALARILYNEGRGMIIIFNKWDKVSREVENAFIEKLKQKVSRAVMIKNPIFFTMSALNEKNITTTILNECLVMYDKLAIKISTAKLNKWLAQMNAEIKMPYIGNHKLKLKYITQTSGKPPSFAIFGNFENQSIPSNCIENIKKHFMQTFDLLEIPIRFVFRKSRN